uniref:Uncharacterized protein n=1 Tax=Salix viminalis TaxID=40686 RepID=A0A6N2L2T6_SALVM
MKNKGKEQRQGQRTITKLFLLNQSRRFQVFSSLIFVALLQDLFGRKVLIVHYLLSSNSIARNKNTTI